MYAPCLFFLPSSLLFELGNGDPIHQAHRPPPDLHAFAVLLACRKRLALSKALSACRSWSATARSPLLEIWLTRTQSTSSCISFGRSPLILPQWWLREEERIEGKGLLAREGSSSVPWWSSTYKAHRKQRRQDRCGEADVHRHPSLCHLRYMRQISPAPCWVRKKKEQEKEDVRNKRLMA